MKVQESSSGWLANAAGGVAMALVVWLVGSVIGCGSGKDMKPDFQFLDEYLRMWDEFARGRNDLVPVLKEQHAAFESELAAALDSEERRAPPRLVLYLALQIGGSVRMDSALGEACHRYFGERVPVFKNLTDRGEVSGYYAGYVYCWWEQHAHDFEEFPLLTEWMARDFGQKIITMYRRHASERSGSPSDENGESNAPAAGAEMGNEEQNGTTR